MGTLLVDFRGVSPFSQTWSEEVMRMKSFQDLNDLELNQQKAESEGPVSKRSLPIAPRKPLISLDTSPEAYQLQQETLQAGQTLDPPVPPSHSLLG